MSIRIKGRFAVGGGEPVSTRMVGVRVYAKDEAAIAALGCDKSRFLRDAISKALADFVRDASDEKLARSVALVDDAVIGVTDLV
jgi:hypothetical protein